MLVPPGGQAVGRQRATEQVALAVLAVELTQHFQLLGLLDAFGKHVEVQAVRQGDDGANDLQIAVILGDALHETLVDLQFVDREAPQVGQ